MRHHRLAGERLAQEGDEEIAVQGRRDDDAVALDDLLPDVHLGPAREGAGVRLGERGERAAGRHQDDQLLLVLDEGREGVLSAACLGAADGRAGRIGDAAPVFRGLGAVEVLLALLVSRIGRHDDVHRRDAVALEEASPVALADVLADVDGESWPVDRAAAIELDDAGGGCDLLAAFRIERALRVPHETVIVSAKEVPRVEEIDSPDPNSFPYRLADGVAAEEGEVEVFDRLVQVLDAVRECLECLALLLGLGVVRGGCVGDRAPAETGEGGLPAFDARHEHGVGQLDLLVDLLEERRAVRAGDVEDVLRLRDGEPLKRVHALKPRGRGGSPGLCKYHLVYAPVLIAPAARGDDGLGDAFALRREAAEGEGRRAVGVAVGIPRRGIGHIASGRYETLYGM